MDSTAQERFFGHVDVGPTDSLPSADLCAAYDAFFGPLSSSEDSASSAPSTRPPSPTNSRPTHSPLPTRPPLPALLPSQPKSGAPAPPSVHTAALSSTAFNRKLKKKARKEDPPNSGAASTSLPPTTMRLGAVPDSSRRLTGNSATRKRKEQSKARKRERRREENAKKPRYGESDRVRNGHVAEGSKSPIATPFDASRAPIATTGFIALPGKGGGVYSVDQLVGKLGFRYVEATEGHRPRAITDTAGRVVAIYAGAPRDAKWPVICQEAYDALQVAASRCRFTAKMKKHRRGNFPALNAGISHGGGQPEPGNLTQNCDANTDAVNYLTNHPAFGRIAGFASSVLETWAPKLFTYYQDNLHALLSWKNTLKRLFDKSVFAAVAFNLGPRTVSAKHRDYANVPFGLCAVTALGHFNHKTSAHMVLWDLRLVLEFPATTTILLTSAIVSHSNTPLQEGETRCSFAQYTAGGLVRWVDHGFQSDDDYFRGMSMDDLEQVRIDNEERCRYGVTLFSTLSELYALWSKKS